jgi:hypothetical protein
MQFHVGSDKGTVRQYTNQTFSSPLRPNLFLIFTPDISFKLVTETANMLEEFFNK